MRSVTSTGKRSLIWLPALILVLTMGQLAVAQWVPGIERFADKAFGARLIAYPIMMLLVPAIWWFVVKRKKPEADAAVRRVRAGHARDSWSTRPATAWTSTTPSRGGTT